MRPADLIAAAFPVLLVAACGGEPPPTARVAPPVQSAAPTPLALPSASAAAPVAANGDPDPARPEDEARAAALMAVGSGTTESSPRFSPDGKSVAFVSSADGPALYLQDLEGGAPPRNVAVIPPRFRRPGFSPDGKSLFFTSDDRGDEAFRMLRMDLSTGSITETAAGEKRRRGSPHFTKSGDRFLFEARGMSETGTTVFEQAMTNGATPVQVYADRERDLADVRADGKQLAVTPTNVPDSVHLVELPAGGSRKLYPSWSPKEKLTRVQNVAYSPDGARVYVATDDGTEKTHVIALDAKTGHELARYTEARPGGGAVQGLLTSATTVAYVIDLGISHELRILDARTLQAKPAPALQIGSEVPGSAHPNNTSGLALSRDGNRAAIQWSSPSTPPRVYIVDTRTGATTPLTKATAANVPTSIDVQTVRIPTFDKLEIPTLVYLPKNPKGKLPVIMQIHGGFPYAATARWDADIAALIDAGYAVVEPNVRGSAGFGVAYERADDGVRKLDGVRDFGFVGRWIAAQTWADPARVAVMGASAGGYYTLMCLAHHPELWRAGVALVPLYDLKSAVSQMDGALRSFLEEREFVPLTEPAAMAALSPSTYVDRIRAPLVRVRRRT